MYISNSQILRSIDSLRIVHPFIGITFVACKKFGLPVGRTASLRMDGLTKSHMDEHHRLAPESSHYFQPFNSTRSWLSGKYPSSGLQAINTQTCARAFIHAPNSQEWGWSQLYLDVVSGLLTGGRRVPIYDLAVWLYRGNEISDSLTENGLVKMFLQEYNITNDEKYRLFEEQRGEDVVVPVRSTPATWNELRTKLPRPPDARPESGGTLGLLELAETGPARQLSMEPAERLTLITGDNGLGKTFLLECAWWALSGSWAGRPALPRHDAPRGRARIRFAVGSSDSRLDPFDIRYDWGSQTWPTPNKRPTIAGLIVYARVDGSFAVWDPAKSQGSLLKGVEATFSNLEVWDGRPGAIEGIVRDWGRWQRDESSWQFQTFVKVLQKLSPPDLGPLHPGELRRIPNDLRDIPTIRHVYGETPILFASAGVKRALALAYLMVWAWKEHQVSSELSKRDPESRMVVLFDEVEAHLHPKWQRQLLPAVVEAAGLLATNLSVQLIMTTHSPLVLASTEPIFSEERDALLHLDFGGESVSLERVPFVKYGDASRWLTSPIFHMRHARSREAEEAIERAKALQLEGDSADPSAVASTTNLLRSYLAGDDSFWPRWIGFAHEFGVDV